MNLLVLYHEWVDAFSMEFSTKDIKTYSDVKRLAKYIKRQRRRVNKIIKLQNRLMGKELKIEIIKDIIEILF